MSPDKIAQLCKLFKQIRKLVTELARMNPHLLIVLTLIAALVTLVYGQAVWWILAVVCLFLGASIVFHREDRKDK